MTFARPSIAADSAASSGKVLAGSTRLEVRRMQISVLLFFTIDALLLTGYGAAGAVSLHLGWVDGVVGCTVAAAIFFGF